MDGILLLNKPAEMTSFSAVNKCRKLIGEKKAGHTGTLDPNATGLMIVLFGKYTKLVPYAISNHKRYQAHFILGKRTDTLDVWGNVLDAKEPSTHSEEEFMEAAKKLTGKIQQLPPMYSAIHVNGKKLYEYARQGIEVERASREVEVSALTVKQIGENEWFMDATVSSGTYIRTLISDLGELLGEYACMSQLHRIAIETATIEQAQTFDEIAQEPHWIDPRMIVDPSIPFIEIRNVAAVKNGRRMRLFTDRDLVILTNEGQILAAYERQEENWFRCVRGLC